VVEAAEVEVAGVRGTRRLPIESFMLGPKRNALGDDELITAVHVPAPPGRETFMKVGPRNAMVIAVASLALSVDVERGVLQAAFGSAGPVVARVTGSLEERGAFPDQVANAASPIDDVRGSAVYRRHALRVLTQRALDRCLT
jgi:CO/xanthine dehydrogenase FAD-binding subunit